MQNSNKNTLKLKDKLNENELDLSLSELTKVPVKEMAAIPRATVVDLSNNKLITLPLNFATLIHIVKLDLSKNQLKELPPNFGDLRRLRHLDLYSNQLERLPVSFHQLKELRWLDLKNNPLVPSLAEAVGDCLDAKACQEAAKKVVKLMTIVNTEIEAKKAKQMVEEQVKQRELLAREAAERERERQQKKAAKEKRKAEALRNYQQSIQTNIKNPNIIKQTSNSNQKSPKPRSKPAAKGSSFCSKLFNFIITLCIMAIFMAAVLTALHWEGPFVFSNLEPATKKAWITTVKYTSEAKEWVSPMVERFQQQIHRLSLFITENSGDVGQVVLERAKYCYSIIMKQSPVIWDTVKERCVDAFTITSKHVVHYWQILCDEFPVYQEIVMEKLKSIFGSDAGQGKQ